MYLLVIHIPFERSAPGAALVSTEWAHDLLLLRESLQGRFGEIVVACPERPPGMPWNQQVPSELRAAEHRIRFVSLCPAGLRARSFWRRAPAIWRTLRKLARQADVVHAGMSELLKPLSQMGFYAGRASDCPTVFIVDMDVRNHIRQLKGASRPWRTAVYLSFYERILQHAVARADLSLLKGESLLRCAGAQARNAHDYVHTAYLRDWVIPPDELDRKTEKARSDSTLRTVFVGRLTPWKGLAGTLRVIDVLRRRGVRAELDVLGAGEQMSELVEQARDLGLADCVRFAGAQTYSRDFVASLRDYHLLLYTPEAEDTPRSIFDAMAAGVPTASFDFEYTRRWLVEENCGIVAPWGDHEALAGEIATLWNDRERLVNMMRRCAQAGAYHAAEEWFTRRAILTFEAVAAHHAPRQGRPSLPSRPEPLGATTEPPPLPPAAPN